MVGGASDGFIKSFDVEIDEFVDLMAELAGDEVVALGGAGSERRARLDGDDGGRASRTEFRQVEVDRLASNRAVILQPCQRPQQIDIEPTAVLLPCPSLEETSAICAESRALALT